MSSLGDTKMRNKSNICAGCLTQKTCYIIQLSETCPCSTCLIKSVYRSGCEDFNNFRDKLIEKSEGNF
jgi:hypothetical protein